MLGACHAIHFSATLAIFKEKRTPARREIPFNYPNGAEWRTRTPTGFPTKVKKDKDFVSRPRKDNYVELPQTAESGLYTERVRRVASITSGREGGNTAMETDNRLWLEEVSR